MREETEFYAAGEADLIDRMTEILGKRIKTVEPYGQFRKQIADLEARVPVLSSRSASVERALMLWDMNKYINDPRIRNGVADDIADFYRNYLEDVSANSQSARSLEVVESLRSDGLAFLPSLMTPGELEEIHQFFRRPHEARILLNMSYYPTSVVVRAPHLLRIATMPLILDAVSQYLGAPGVMVDITAWVSSPGKERPGAECFHRDRDDFRACKLFIYLSDVGPMTGPHIFLKKSHRLEEVYARIPESEPSREMLVGKLFASSAREELALVEKYLGDDAIEIVGPAGTAFLETTYGFHRGKEPVDGRRFIFQVLFGLVPYHHRSENMKKGNLSQLPPGVPDDAPTRHVLRLLLDSPRS